MLRLEGSSSKNRKWREWSFGCLVLSCIGVRQWTFLMKNELKIKSFSFSFYWICCWFKVFFSIENVSWVFYVVLLGDSHFLEDESTKVFARKVADHYSRRTNQTLEEREASPIIHLKKLNNWVCFVISWSLLQAYYHSM